MHSDVCETVCMYTLGSPPLPDVPPEGPPHHSLLSFASHSREPPTAFGRWRMIPSHMHACLPTVHHIVQLTASSKYHPACVCVCVCVCSTPCPEGPWNMHSSAMHKTWGQQEKRSCEPSGSPPRCLSFSAPLSFPLSPSRSSAAVHMF